MFILCPTLAITHLPQPQKQLKGGIDDPGRAEKIEHDVLCTLFPNDFTFSRTTSSQKLHFTLSKKERKMLMVKQKL